MRSALTLSLILLFAWVAEPASAQTFFVVTSDGDGEPSDLATPDGVVMLREAMIAANTNAPFGDAPAGSATRRDWISFDPSLSSVTLRGFLPIGGAVILDGTVGSGELVLLSMPQNARLHLNVTTSEPVEVRDLILRGGGGGGSTGGSMRLGENANVRVQRCQFERNRGLNGGAIGVNPGAMLEVLETQFVQNRAVGSVDRTGGGAIYNEGTVELTDVTFTQNRATVGTARGGAILTTDGGTTQMLASVRFEDNQASSGGALSGDPGSTHEIADTDFVGNLAGPVGGNGGAIHVRGPAMLTINGGTLTGNTAFGSGGGVWVGGGVTTSLDGSTISGNLARSTGGGGLFIERSPVFLSNIAVTGNRAIDESGRGGGILHLGDTSDVLPALYNDIEISGNLAARGAGLTVSGATLEGRRVLVQANVARDQGGPAPGRGGGGHISDGAVVAFSDSEVLGNRGFTGGGLLVEGSTTALRLTYSTIGENTARKRGGGIFLSGAELDVSRSLFRANEAGTSGGAIAQFNGVLHLVVSTVSGNTGRTGGGGLYWFSMGDNAFRSEMDFVTFARNRSIFGSAAIQVVMSRDAVRRARVARSIIAESVPSQNSDVVGPIEFVDSTVESQTGVPLNLGPLADNGGATQTHALPDGSPLIDACPTSAPSLAQDQRGIDRVGPADCGAYESAAPAARTDARLAQSGPVRIDGVAPNPVSHRGTVTFTVAEAQTVQVVLYDMLGRRVQDVFEGEVGADESVRANVDATRLATGGYVLRLQGETVQASERVTVVR